MVVGRGQPLDVLGKTDLIRLLTKWMPAVRERRRAGAEVYSTESRGMGCLLVQMRSLLKEQFWGMRRVFICGGCIQFWHRKFERSICNPSRNVNRQLEFGPEAGNCQCTRGTRKPWGLQGGSVHTDVKNACGQSLMALQSPEVGEMEKNHKGNWMIDQWGGRKSKKAGWSQVKEVFWGNDPRWQILYLVSM